MKLNKPIPRGLTLVEALVVVAVLAILAGLVYPALRSPRTHSKAIQCINKLKQTGLGFRIFEIDHRGRFPMQMLAPGRFNAVPTSPRDVVEILRGLSNELSHPYVLVCPADDRSPATDFGSLNPTNVSYFFGVDPDPTNVTWFLSGDRNVTNGIGPVGNVLTLTTNQTATDGAGWTDTLHHHSGNVVMADGSVQQTTSARLRDLVRRAGAEQRLMLPLGVSE